MDQDANIDPNDPRLTAYALGELDETERAAVESLLAESPEASQAVDKIRQTADVLKQELAAEPTAGLDDAHRRRIEDTLPLRRGRGTRWWVDRAVAASLLLAAGSLIAYRSPPRLTESRREGEEMIEYYSQPAEAEEGLGGERYAQADRPPVAAAPASPGPGYMDLVDLAGNKVVEVGSAERERVELWGVVRANNYVPKQFSVPSDSDGILISASKEDVEAVERILSELDVDGQQLDPQHVNDTQPRRTFSLKNLRSEEAKQLIEQLQRAGHTIRRGADVLYLYSSESEADEGVNPGGPPDALFGTEAYDQVTDNPFELVTQAPLSTFSIDVDTASYANIRRFLTAGQLPPADAVRIEEMVNYFSYDYPQPTGEAPFSADVAVAECPWTPEHLLVRIGLQGRVIPHEERPAGNLVFLLDVSGSMRPPNKLPLLKQTLRLLVNELDAYDSVAIVVYAGASGLVLPSTTADNQQTILHALDRLESGGSTNGGAGIELAYDVAAENFIEGGTNRVILATDGDFNVGVTGQGDLTRLIEEKAGTGVFLSVLGFGMGNYKDATLEKLADKGNGNYAYIDTLAEGRKVLVEQMGGTLITIAKDVKIQVEFNPAHAAAYRLIGYENRILAARDFNDDTKDAGEIGAGHTVTALYEVVPAGLDQEHLSLPSVDPLKYQSQPEPTEVVPSDDLLTLKVRYKEPDGDVSKLLEFSVTDDGITLADTPDDFRFAAAVASFGMLLRHSPHAGDWTYEAVLELANGSLGEDAHGYRAEFVTLVKQASAINPR